MHFQTFLGGTSLEAVMAVIFKHIGKMFALDMVSDLTPAIVCENITKCTRPLGIARLLDAEGVEVFWQLWVV